MAFQRPTETLFYLGDKASVIFELSVFNSFSPGFDDEVAISAAGILWLIPLKFAVPFEALFEIPDLGIRGAVLIKLVRPDEFP